MLRQISLQQQKEFFKTNKQHVTRSSQWEEERTTVETFTNNISTKDSIAIDKKTMSNISNDLFSIWVTHKMVALTDKQGECYQTHLPQTSLNVTNKLTNIITIRMWEGKELRS